MPTRKWFVKVGDEEMGPLGPGGLRRLVRRGQITAETYVRREDHAEAVLASRVRGLLPAEELPVLEPVMDEAPEPGPDDEAEPRGGHRHPRVRRADPVIHGPFTALRSLGWAAAGVMFAFALLGAYGVWAARGQLAHASEVMAGARLESAVADVRLFGIGIWAILALVVAGSLFLWWLWTARVNLPHLIQSHIRMAPSWAVISWFLPFVNLVQPYSLVSETDKLSAEADADGDASVHADHRLLLTWWLCAIFGTLCAVTYLALGPESGEALRTAAWFHLLAGIFTFVGAVFCGWIVLRITGNQERAHERHPEPVKPHHEIKRGKSKKARSAALQAP